MILSSSFGYSQDTKIKLSNNIARLIVKDLILGDKSQKELFLTKQQINILNSKVSLKDSIISKQIDMIQNYSDMISTRDEQIFTSSKLSKKLNLDLKKQKAKTKLFQLGGTTVLVGALVLIVL